MRDIHPQIYIRSISIPEYHDLREAIDEAERKDGTTYIVNHTGKRTAAIVAVDDDGNIVLPDGHPAKPAVAEGRDV